MVMQLDLEGVDEQVSAIHCLGNLALYCSGLMQPYLTTIWDKLQNLGGYVHENVRYHICLSFTQIAFGQLKFCLGKADSDEKLEWKAGLPVQQPLPAEVKTFVNTRLMPHLKEVMESEMSKEVVEKVLECIRDLADEIGPDAVIDHVDWIVGTIEQLLDKTSMCQNP